MTHTLAIVFGEYLFVLPVLVGAIYFFWQSGEVKKRMVILSALSLVIAVSLMFVLNSVYNDPRPTAVLNFQPLFHHFFANNGFPSSHATLTALVACVLYVFNRKIGVFLLVVSVLVSVARVSLSLHHYPDIIAGILTAIIATVLAQAILKKFLPTHFSITPEKPLF